MITFNNTKTIYDLVKRVGTEFENQVFVRYEKDDTIYEKATAPTPSTPWQ